MSDKRQLNQASWTNDASANESAAQSSKMTMLQRVAPFGDTSLSFEMTMPDGWVEDRDLAPIDAPDEYLVTIARFRQSAKSELPVIEVNFTIIGEEVGLADWFDLYVQMGELRLLRPKRAAAAETVAPLLRYRARQPVGERECIGEYGLIRDGNRIFLVIGTAAEDDFRKIAGVFDRSIQSFRLLNPASSKYAEPVSSVNGRDGQRLFSYPSRWELVTLDGLSPGKRGADLRFVEEGDVLGYIRAKQLQRSAYPDITPEGAFREARLEVEDSGFQPSRDGWQLVPAPFSTSFGVSELKFARGTFAGVKDEVWIQVVTGDEALHVFTLLTPSRSENVRQWMINRRAFEIVIGSLIPG